MELSDDVAELRGKPGLLVKVLKVDNGVLSIDPTTVTGSGLPQTDKLVNPKVRRWDQTQAGDIVLTEGAIPVKESPDTEPVWINLEDGLQVRFDPGGHYSSGDHWLIPARVATGKIEWPTTTDATGNTMQASIPPRGIVHHYAPLGLCIMTAEGLTITSCRCVFKPFSSCFHQA